MSPDVDFQIFSMLGERFVLALPLLVENGITQEWRGPPGLDYLEYRDVFAQDQLEYPAYLNRPGQISKNSGHDVIGKNTLQEEVCKMLRQYQPASF